MPAASLSVTPGEALRAFREVGAASLAPRGDRAGSQNYVGIYPPLYYAVIGRVEAGLHIRNVFDQAFGARLVSAALLGLTGVLMDLVVGLVLRRARPRAALTAAVGLLFPTLGMLGGAVTNDLMADAASLAVFYLAAGAMAGRVRAAAAVWFGVVAGLVTGPKKKRMWDWPSRCRSCYGAYGSRGLFATRCAGPPWRRGLDSWSEGRGCSFRGTPTTA